MPAPCLACHRSPDRAWDTGPVAGGSNVSSTPDQASQASSKPIRGDRSKMPELCTRPAPQVADGGARGNQSPGREGCPRGRHAKAPPALMGGCGGHAQGPLLSRGLCWEGQSLPALVLEKSLSPCSGCQWWKPCGSSQSSGGDAGAPKGGRQAPARGREPAQAQGPLSCTGTSWAAGLGCTWGHGVRMSLGLGDPSPAL